ncbi:MAG TPA: M20/M25/M40 family metallo-hydrolase [Vicinamibacterales bacterium]|jgi:carboxypeptidase Q|nr:M20/M25/M40 family metallo-hydrolase [Vicinamibacterales bacterium]
MKRRVVFVATILLLLLGVQTTTQQSGGSDLLARLRIEGLQRSRALPLYRTLTDDIGSRLTGSPAHVRAANWARDRFMEWGLTNPHLEPYEFGHGWQLDKISVEMTEPRYFPLIAYAEAWTPSTKGVVSGRVVYIGDKTASQIEAMAGQLRGAIVLTHLPQTEWVDKDRPQPGLDDKPVATGNPTLPGARSTTPVSELMPLLARAGVAVALRPSAYRDGTVGVLGNRMTSTDAVPSIVVAGEQYNVLARLAAAGQAVALRVELRTQYLENDRNSYNVIAEIPGRDSALRDQIVLVGAHLDSWHTASGATDNADGAVAVMEAARMLRALGAEPRRTIRFALWSGEEQGLLGARAYLAQHFSTPTARDQLAVYLNDDPGSGKTLGFYMEGNGAAKVMFDRWLEPLKELGATRNVIEGIGATDHVPFNEAGLPGFNVIKDFDAYDVRTRHTNDDFPERMSEDELKESAIVMATFAWQSAMADEKIPRKPAR